MCLKRRSHMTIGMTTGLQTGRHTDRRYVHTMTIGMTTGRRTGRHTGLRNTVYVFGHAHALACLRRRICSLQMEEVNTF